MPCAWCILQRMAYLGLMIFGLSGLLMKYMGHLLMSRFLAFNGIAMSIFGMWSAYQQASSVKDSSNCGISLANKWLMKIDMESISKVFFQVKANCSDASFPIAGIPMEWVSMTGFALAFLICVLATINNEAFMW